VHGNGSTETPRLDRAGTGLVLRVGDDDGFATGGLRYPRRPRALAGLVPPPEEAWEPGQRLAFTATAVSPGIVRALIDDCRIEAAPSGTCVTYTTYLEPVSVFRPLMGLMKGLMGKQLDKGMRALAARAEGR
jgi:hypothetical protein